MRASCWVRAAIAAAASIVAAGAAAGSLKPLDSRSFNALAWRAESQLQQQAAQVLRLEFHRGQGFAWRGEEGRHARVVSLRVQAEGQPAACVLAFEQRGRLQLVDARAGDAEMPWACEGEPAMTLADVDRDGLSDLLVLYPYRAPSGAEFQLPLVLRHRGEQAGVVTDEARTQWLREPAQMHPPVQSVRQLKPLLQRYPRP